MQDASLKKIRRALVSVSDKRGLAEFARHLARHRIEIISTGGTARLLRNEGLAVRDVSDLTEFPEMLDGRVKTLHPRVHGGILAIRAKTEHTEQMRAHGIEPIDLVVVNLYPFRETVTRPDVSMAEAIENIDIGGPSMIRSAAKNHHDVAVVVDPGDYEMVAAMLDAHDGALPQVVRYQLALTAFRHTSAYDREIARFLWSRHPENPEVALGEELARDAELPQEIDLTLSKVSSLRYGENPHQRAALYRLDGDREPGVATAEQLQGKELSYNNLLDSDAAWELVVELSRLPEKEAQTHACAIIKHTNPCGVGTGGSSLEAFQKARATDPVSAFGGIIAFTEAVDEAAAREIAEMFAEVIIAPDFTPEARAVLGAKKNLRVLRMGEPPSRARQMLEMRRVSGGLLVQDRDGRLLDEERLSVVTTREPSNKEMRSLLFAWAICKHVKSNAIVYAGEGQLIGVGAGQMSRVDSVRFGALKAQLPLAGSVLASDAFFPFRDGIDEAVKSGITAVIQPGGSVRDKEVIEAANEHNLAMVFTGLRHFRH